MGRAVFTPYELCKMMAKMTADKEHLESIIAERGFVRASEPYMLLAFRDRVKATNNDIKFFKKDRPMELKPFFAIPPVYTNYASFRKAVGAAAEGCLA